MIAAQLRRVASREEQRAGEIEYVRWLEAFVGGILPPVFRYGQQPPEQKPYEVVRQGSGW